MQRVRMSAVAKQVISTEQAPAALGPYSQVRRGPPAAECNFECSERHNGPDALIVGEPFGVLLY